MTNSRGRHPQIPQSSLCKWFTISALLAAAAQAAEPVSVRSGTLWREPSDIANRNLLYGCGGKKDMPADGPFQFLKEDMNGSNPKLTVSDSRGVKWKVKLGAEARPETVATRFVWAVGYFTDEDYFIERADLTEVPFDRLHRLKGRITRDSVIRNARFEREHKGEKTEANWSWKQSQFTGTQELNGLRVLMAVINNWDVKDQNNAVYKTHEDQFYVVSDLGATFGPTKLVPGHGRSRGNLKAFEDSRFITHTSAERVDFASPGRPSLVCLVNPRQFFMRVRLESVGNNIPRADAKWMGALLTRLSRAQIRDAFRSAGYAPAEVESFSRVIEKRVAALNAL